MGSWKWIVILAAVDDLSCSSSISSGQDATGGGVDAAAVADAAREDGAPVDALASDTAFRDAAARDSGELDAAMPDSGGLDASTPDGGGTCSAQIIPGWYQLMLQCTGTSGTQISCVSQAGCTVVVDDGYFMTQGAVSSSNLVTFDNLAVAATPPARCSGMVTTGQLTLQCDNGCSVAFTRPAQLTETGLCCDPLAMTCGQNQKCTLISTTEPNVVGTTACVDIGGAGALGQSCTRTAIGHDSCAQGLFCAETGSPTGTSTCRSLCASYTDCPANNACYLQEQDVPNASFCIPTCTLFPDSCGLGLSCTAFYTLHGRALNDFIRTSVCLVRGSGASGTTCMTDTDCLPGLGCVLVFPSGNQFCSSYCDSSHPCPAPLTCNLPTSAMQQPGVPAIGYCTQ
jgi:hypothetical protein